MEQNKVMSANEWHEFHNLIAITFSTMQNYAEYFHSEMSKPREEVETETKRWYPLVNSSSPYQDTSNSIALSCREAMLKGYELGQRECLALLEWLLKNEFKKDEDICFRAYKGTGSHQFTPDDLMQLFTIFKNRKG